MEMLNNAAVLQVRPNWQEPVMVEWSYKTEIFTARDGTEQRRAMRQKPRRRIDFKKRIVGSAGRSFRTAMADNSRGLSVIENFLERVPIAPSATPTTVSLAVVGFVPYWAQINRGIVINASGNQQFRTIVNVTATTIRIDNAAIVDASTTIAPVIIGRVDEEQNYTRLTTTVGEATLGFLEEPTEMLDPLSTSSEAEPMHHGFPVASFRPNWAHQPTESFPQRFDLLDYGYGKTFTYLIEPQAHWQGSVTCLGRNRVEVNRAQTFFHRRKGRLGAFYMPTWQRDMELVSGAHEGSQVVTVQGTDAFDLFHGSFVYRNITLIASDVFIAVGVKAVEIFGGNTRLTLDAPLPPLAERTAFLSWLLMVRFGSDEFAVTWVTDEVAEFDFSVVGLFDRFYELNASLDRITFSEDYLTFPPFKKKAVIVSPIPELNLEPLTIEEEFVTVRDEYVGYQKDQD